MLERIKRALANQSDLVLVLAVIGILLVLFAPIPAALLDLLIIINVSFALLILLMTFYVERPLNFSTFPSLLLIATLFRLSLNIAATRLILSEGDAGKVIRAVGEHVVGGNYVIGLIVFLVLIVVQYVVVTNGAQRVAEVAARFTLDSMPGKQMSIDADMNAGLIDEKEARQRRKEIEKEGNFYGAMDGASKFVKGDAIAGIIIILIDIVGGLAIGVAQRGMRWADALQTYTLLTVGDGIVTQIPALIISTGTGVIVTRAASDEFLSKEVARQVTAHPKTFFLIAGGLFGLLLLPGIPPWPVLGVIAVVLFLAWYSLKRQGAEQEVEEGGAVSADAEDDLYSGLQIEPIEVSVGQGLIGLISGEDRLFSERVSAFRKQYASESGLVIPPVRVKDNRKLPEGIYEILIFGARVAKGELLKDGLLAIDPGTAKGRIAGKETKDPTYGLPAVWVARHQRDEARAAGYTLVEPSTVLMTHLTEVIKNNAASLLTRGETERLVNRARSRDPGLVEELVPSILSLSDIQKVLQSLLRERVSIRNMDLILEVLVDAGKYQKDPEQLTETVRQRLGPMIVQALTDEGGELKVLTLDPSVERTIASSVRSVGENSAMVLEPRLTERIISGLVSQVEQMMKDNLMPVLLCAPEIRRYVHTLTERVVPHLSVLSMTEIPANVRLRSYGMVAAASR